MSFGKSMNLNHRAGILLTIALFAFGTRASLGAPAFESTQPAQKAVGAGTPTLPADVQHIADWAVHSGDHKGLPFIIVDKVNAMAVAFDSRGVLVEATPALLGIGAGDVFAPGVVSLNMYDTQPWQRI